MALQETDRRPPAGIARERETGADDAVPEPAWVPHRLSTPDGFRIRASCRLAARRSARLRRAVPTGGRRSKPSPRFFSNSDTRFPWASPSGADRRSAFPCLRAARAHGAAPPLAAAGRRRAREFRLPARSAGRFPDGAPSQSERRNRPTPARGPVRGPLDPECGGRTSGCTGGGKTRCRGCGRRSSSARRRPRSPLPRRRGDPRWPPGSPR